MKNNLKPVPSGIRRVSYYIACPVETCDRCSQGIKRVALFEWKDGSKMKVGLDCAEAILNGDTTLRSHLRKSIKQLERLNGYMRVLSLPWDEMPIDARGYYGRGVYFVADEQGKAICFEKYIFHPFKRDAHFDEKFDGRLTHYGRNGYEPNVVAVFEREQVEGYQEVTAKIAVRIRQLEKFIANTLNMAIFKSEKESAQSAK